MRLISLTANKGSFRSVHFNRSGPTYILACQKDPESSDHGKTYNGVGKSLIVSLIHFCLGAGEHKVFKEKLPGWEFALRFEIDGKAYKAIRSTDNQKKIKLNDSELSISKFRDQLAAFCFDVPDGAKYLTWRSLLPVFLRPNRKAYVTFDNPGAWPDETQRLMVNCFLLGIDVFLVLKKLELRKDQERIGDLIRNFKNDEVLRDYFTGDRSSDLALIDLADQIDRLEKDLEAFEVAEDYHDIKQQADELQHYLQSLQDRLVLLKTQIENIDKSLQLSPDLDRDKIQKIYEEAQIHFPDAVQKRLQDVEAFHRDLALHRQTRLTEQKNRINTEINSTNADIKQGQTALDDKLQYLGAHRALDVFVKLSNRLADLRAKREKLAGYEEMLAQYKVKQNQIDEAFIQENVRTEEYLTEIEPQIKRNRDFFRRLAKRFYPNSAAGITIDNNDGKSNKKRFDFDARIEADGSDGINNVKIFCYDLSILFLRNNHRVDFLFHDSRLFDGVDERQKATMFQLVQEMFSSSDKQYIASLNQNQVLEVQRVLSKEEYQTFVQDYIVLKLTDDSPAEKLLGINVDMRYEK